jgi:hypothetical protein
MMVEYVAVPARLIGVTPNHLRRDQLTPSAVGGAVGAVICSPSYVRGRVALVMLGSHTLRLVAVLLLAVAIVLQTGATSAVKAIKLSAKLATGHGEAEAGAEPRRADGGSESAGGVRPDPGAESAPGPGRGD